MTDYSHLAYRPGPGRLVDPDLFTIPDVGAPPVPPRPRVVTWPRTLAFSITLTVLLLVMGVAPIVLGLVHGAIAAAVLRVRVA